MLRARSFAVAFVATAIATATLTATATATPVGLGRGGAPPPAAADPIVAPTIDPFDRQSVLEAYESSLVAARSVPVGWTGNASTCTRGTESAASIEATRAAVNFYRALNRLEPITMDATYNAKSLASSLIMQANATLTHEPVLTLKCYTTDGFQGASSGNLSQGLVAARAVDGYMEDPGSFNYFAGHRRWLLYPPATTFGTGSTTSYNTLWVFGRPGSRPTVPDWVAWPNQGFVPKSLVKPLFSLSSNIHPGANYANATVTVKVGATALAVTKHPLENGYGDNTLTWQVALPPDFASSDADVRFDITVTGIRTAAGAALPTLAYSSTAVVRSTPPQVPGAPSAVTASAGDGRATVTWKAPTSNGGATVTGYKVTPYVGDVAQPTRTFNSAATSQAITGLSNGTAYRFQVAAVNSAGTGPASALSGTVTPSKPPYAPFASWGAMVDRIFLDLTAKAPTATERSSWIAQLGNGSKTSGDLVVALRTGPDNTSAVDPGTRLYRAFLGRTPDAGGLEFWVSRRRAGTWTLMKMADNFAASPEFTRRYGSLTNRQFVTLIYTDVLGRPADPSGVDYWTRQLDLGRRTRGSVMVGFSESNEYKTAQQHSVDVAVAFIFLLGRAPTDEEVRVWNALRQEGTAHAVLAKQLLDSTEYARLIG